MEVCVLKGDDFARSRRCQSHGGPRWLDQGRLLCALMYRRHTLGLEVGLCGISALERKKISQKSLIKNRIIMNCGSPTLTKQNQCTEKTKAKKLRTCVMWACGLNKMLVDKVPPFFFFF